jgi:hypothetical protein
MIGKEIVIKSNILEEKQPKQFIKIPKVLKDDI